MTQTIMRIQGNLGVVTVIAKLRIAAGVDGQIDIFGRDEQQQYGALRPMVMDQKLEEG